MRSRRRKARKTNLNPSLESVNQSRSVNLDMSTRCAADVRLPTVCADDSALNRRKWLAKPRGKVAPCKSPAAITVQLLHRQFTQKIRTSISNNTPHQQWYEARNSQMGLKCDKTNDGGMRGCELVL